MFLQRKNIILDILLIFNVPPSLMKIDLFLKILSNYFIKMVCEK